MKLNLEKLIVNALMPRFSIKELINLKVKVMKGPSSQYMKRALILNEVWFELFMFQLNVKRYTVTKNEMNISRFDVTFYSPQECLIGRASL